MKRLTEELQQKHQTELSVLKAELEKEMKTNITDLQITLEKEKEKLSYLQAALENDESKKCKLILYRLNLILKNGFVFGTFDMFHLGPEVVIIKQRLEAQYDGELKKAKSCMAKDIKELNALLQEQGREQLCQALKR